MKLLVAFGFVLSFAVAVTGLATVLNGLFGWHISLEGTEAPADAIAGTFLFCLAGSIAMVCVPFAHGRLRALLLKRKLLIAPYVLATIAITAAPLALAFKVESPYAEAHAALWRGENEVFTDGAKLEKIEEGDRQKLFAESIRHNRADIARLIAPTLLNLTGERDSPNAFLAAYIGNAEILSLLIKRNADFSFRQPLTGTGIVHQIVSGKGSTANQVTCLRLLRRQGLFDANATGNFGTTPLMIAAERGNFEVVSLLLEYGAAVNQQDESKSTALHKACDKTIIYPDTSEAARIAVLKRLVKAGGIPSARNSSGDNCKSLAERAGFGRLADFVGRNG